jgi:hypothetical protein
MSAAPLLPVYSQSFVFLSPSPLLKSSIVSVPLPQLNESGSASAVKAFLPLSMSSPPPEIFLSASQGGTVQYMVAFFN